MKRALFLATLLLATAAMAGEKGQPAPKLPAALPDLPAGLSSIRVRLRASSRPATPDLLVAVWRCPRCKRLNAARRLLPEQPPFDQLKDVRSMLERVALGRGGGWSPPAAEPCATCKLRPPAKVLFSEALFFRYLPETGCDAVARVPVRGGEMGKLTWGKLDVSGAYDPVGEIPDQESFARAFGRCLSVREAWSEAVRECIAKGASQVVKVAPGYFLVCRRRSRERGEEERLAAGLAIKLAKAWGRLPSGTRTIELTAVAGSPLEKVIPTYRRWLPGQWRQLEGGKHLAAAVLDPGAFWTLAARELAASGVKLSRSAAAPGRDPDLRLGDYGVSLSAEAVLLKTAYAGLSFGEGLHQFVRPLALQLAKAEKAGELSREALSAYETSVLGGRVLLAREKPAKGKPPGSGREVARLDVFALAGSIDLRSPGAVGRALGGLLGLDPVTGRIRPPSLAETRDPSGRRVWLTRKLRPHGYFEKLGTKVLVEEWRGLDAAWSLDTVEGARFLPARPAPGGRDLAARFEKDLAHHHYAVLAAKGLAWEGLQARAAVGQDIASALIHPRLRRGLARRLKAELKDRELSFWAPTSNVVLVSLKPITGRRRGEFRRAAEELVRQAGLAPGSPIDLEIREKLTGEKSAGFFP